VSAVNHLLLKFYLNLHFKYGPLIDIIIQFSTGIIKATMVATVFNITDDLINFNSNIMS
jgi:hypothetical protein